SRLERCDKQSVLRRGLILEYITLGWNVVEVVIVILAALAGFGLDLRIAHLCLSGRRVATHRSESAARAPFQGGWARRGKTFNLHPSPRRTHHSMEQILLQYAV
ncbi:MAG: hypothetical protein ACJ8CB_07225, partial [Ktedonobacteraceae bacterium]